MPTAEIVFWGCVGIVAYPYLIYPLILAVLARLRPRPVSRIQGYSPSISFIVCAHNEQTRIERRLEEFIRLLKTSGNSGEIIVVSDGSTDDTAAVVRLWTKEYVRLLELPASVGKAEALNRGVALARGDVLVFADVRQTWAPDALQRLLENFADEDIGAVSGDLVVSASGTMSGVGLYWQVEKWFRRNESQFGSQVGVTGAISACRRRLFTPIPRGTLLDDVYWPLCVAMKGYRVIHDQRAVALDRLPERTRDEFRRKVRTLAGNFQLAARLPRAMVPWHNPVWYQLISRKMARLLVPWGLVGAFVANLFCEGWWFDLALGLQILGYAFGILGLLSGRGGRVASAAASFLVLNVAAWVAFWVWITGRSTRSWKKVSYDTPRKSPKGDTAALIS